jgi:hypothetical protein
MVEMGCDLTSYPISFSMNPSKGRAALSNAVINQFKVFIMKHLADKTISNEEGIFNSSIKYKTLVQFDGQTVKPADYFPVWINNLAR